MEDGDMEKGARNDDAYYRLILHNAIMWILKDGVIRYVCVNEVTLNPLKCDFIS